MPCTQAAGNPGVPPTPQFSPSQSVPSLCSWVCPGDRQPQMSERTAELGRANTEARDLQASEGKSIYVWKVLSAGMDTHTGLEKSAEPFSAKDESSSSN